MKKLQNKNELIIKYLNLKELIVKNTGLSSNDDLENVQGCCKY